MKTSIAFFFLALAFLSAEGKAQSVELMSKAEINVYDRFGQVNEDLNSQRPSCAVVKYRLQEYFKRANEAEDFLGWYNPAKMDAVQTRGLLNLFQRAPFFTNDRKNKNVRVFFQWELPRDLYAELIKNQVLPKRIFRDKEIWSDPFNGYLPEEFTFAIYDRQMVIAQMSMMMTYESYCLETPKTQLLIETEGLTVNFTGTHDPEEL